MRFLKNLLLFLVVVAIALIGVAFVLPNTAHLERSITINRPGSEVFAVLNNMHRFNAWSPWFDLDPNAKYTWSGPDNGVGSKLSWVGNKDVGSGSMEIKESKPSDALKIALDFGDMGKADSHFALAPSAAATKVTWSFDSDAPLAFDGKFVWNVIGRYMCLFMDKMVGADYDKGLAKLKSLVESFPAADISGVQGEVVQRTPQKIYFVSASSGNDPESAKAALSQAYGKIRSFIQNNGVTIQGAPMSITTSFDENSWKFDAALPVDRNDVEATGDIKRGDTYAGKAIQFMHVGTYDKLAETAQKAHAWLVVQGYKSRDRVIEEYITDPGNTPVEQLQTRLVIPVE